MDEYSANKLGEVMAFAEVGLETFLKGADALKQVLHADFQPLIEENQNHSHRIRNLAKELGVEETVLRKAQATSKKLTSMRDLYLQGEWADAVELFEWSGFFEGAAVIHWSLVYGKARKLKIEKLRILAQEATKFHQALLRNIAELISR